MSSCGATSQGLTREGAAVDYIRMLASALTRIGLTLSVRIPAGPTVGATIRADGRFSKLPRNCVAAGA